MSRVSRVLMLVAAVVAARRPTSAQSAAIALSAEPSCRTCSIEVTRVATLGQLTDSVLLPDFVGVVAVNSRGEYLVPVAGGFQVGIYDSSGRLLRVVGKRGRGPGEFVSITHIEVIAGDSVLVADQLNNVQLFTPDLLRFVRPVRITDPGGLAQALIRHDGSIVQSQSRELRSYAPTGGVARVIPLRTTSGTDSTCRMCGHRWLAQSSQPGLFWSTISDRYDIELIDTSGVVRRTLSRQPMWFFPRTPSPPGPRGERPRPVPAVGGIREDSRGLLWVVSTVADANWKPQRSGIATSERSNAQKDVMLTVIDPVAGTVLAERRLPNVLGFVGRDLAFTASQNTDGYVTVQIWRFELKRQ